jgi:hypothetical protein
MINNSDAVTRRKIQTLRNIEKDKAKVVRAYKKGEEQNFSN